MTRRWQLGPKQPYTLTLAADARFCRTDYLDDQVWDLSLGAGESPALALQTRYGGRAGLVSLVPMWVIDGRAVYQAQAYAKPPLLTAFAPGFAQAQGKITPTIAVRAEYWSLDSHVIGGRFTLGSTGKTPVTVRLDLLVQVLSDNREQRVNAERLRDGVTVVWLGAVGNLEPVVILEGADVIAENGRIGSTLTVTPNGKVAVHWVHVGLNDDAASLALGRKALKQNWATLFRHTLSAASALPQIETGDEELNATIAAATVQAVQAFLRPTASLPYASFVTTRQRDRGYSARGSGTDHARGWSGQDVPSAYQLALAVASIEPAWAQGVVRNYLAVQQDDGWIDSAPGLGGQKRGTLCLPILARLAWGVFQYTEDDSFLRETFAGLLAFFRRWQQRDLDADGDGVPEWQSEAQTGFPYLAMFGVGLPYGQQADIRLVEAPDLMAYLLSEAVSLRTIAYYLHDAANEQMLDGEVQRLAGLLETFWDATRGVYGYRDRDTHTRSAGVPVVTDGGGAADEEHFPVLTLDPPSRLIVRISGGLDLVPRLNITLAGQDHTGKEVRETLGSDAFVWGSGHGVCTSKTVFRVIERVLPEGLSRVYRIDVRSLDTLRADVTGLLPLWSVGIPAERAEALLAQLQARFVRASGVTLNAVDDAEFDPANADGSGAVWTYWVTVIGEGLIECGRLAEAADLLGRLLRTQTAVLKANKQFSEFYHADQPTGLGMTSGHAGGLVPLHLVLRVMGVRVVSAGKVWAGGAFVWQTPVTITQHGVVVRRSGEGTQIQFPSGHAVALPPSAAMQEVSDPRYRPPATSVPETANG